MNEVPDQPLNPPEPSPFITYWEWLEHEQDRLHDQDKEAENDND